MLIAHNLEIAGRDAVAQYLLKPATLAISNYILFPVHRQSQKRKIIVFIIIIVWCSYKLKPYCISTRDTKVSMKQSNQSSCLFGKLYTQNKELITVCNR
jgi:hypothetical protein